MRTTTWLSAAMALAIAGSAARAESQAVHRVVDPGSIQWTVGPNMLPGSKSAVLYGDPTKPELFVMRLWLAPNYKVPPHTHSRPEIITIISGNLMLGMGTDGDKAKTRKLGPGTFSAMAPNTPHYGFTDEETIIQISTIGPWTVTFVNPADDPRNKTASPVERGR